MTRGKKGRAGNGQGRFTYGPVLRNLVIRTEDHPSMPRVIIGSLGAALTIALIALLDTSSHYPLLATAFGSSCVLVFTLPESTVSQPINVAGGHVVTTICGLVAAHFLPIHWWSIGVTLAVSIILMALLRVTHPPAGANPLVVMSAATPWSYVLWPMCVGIAIVIVMGLIYHRFTGTVYPVPVER